MSNILKNNNIPIDFRPCYDEYWDFCLNTDLSSVLVKKGLQTRCLISYIDTNNSNCVWFDKLYGNEKYKWEEAVNSGVNTNYIGYTGVDNGFINYQKDRISNQKFYDLFTKSNLTIAENDFRIRLNKVYGNNMIYDYTSDIVEEDGVIEVAQITTLPHLCHNIKWSRQDLCSIVDATRSRLLFCPNT